MTQVGLKIPLPICHRLQFIVFGAPILAGWRGATATRYARLRSNSRSPLSGTGTKFGEVEAPRKSKTVFALEIYVEEHFVPVLDAAMPAGVLGSRKPAPAFRLH
jgi:hypothetical protein